MATNTYAITVPSTATAGAPVDVSTAARDKTVYFFSTNSDTVYLETSPDGTNWSRDPSLVFSGSPAPRRVSFDATRVRAVRQGASAGTPTMAICAVELPETAP